MNLTSSGASSDTSHLLMLDIDVATAARHTALDLLLDLASGTEAFRLGKASAHVGDGYLVVLFAGDPTGPIKCALELWDTLRELPPIPVRTALHSGQVELVEAGLAGEGVREAHQLLVSGAAGQIQMTKSYAESLGDFEEWASFVRDDASLRATGPRPRTAPQKVVFLNADEETADLRKLMESVLIAEGHQTYVDPAGPGRREWAKQIAAKIREADTLVAFVSQASAQSELLQHQLEVALDERRRRGGPLVLPIWIHAGPTEVGPLATLDQNIFSAVWEGPADTKRVVQEVLAALHTGLVEIEPERVDTFDRAMLDDRYYVRRPTDDQLEAAIRMQESIVLVKGPHQIGKSTLIARGIDLARRLGWRTVSTDFQKLSGRQLDSETDFYRVVATTLCRELGFEYDFDAEWLEELGANLNMDSFLRTLLEASERPLIWFVDEADRLFGSPFASDFFGLVRAWHNARATDPRGPRGRLTIVIGYATEAHLFIRDLNRSPFNVGLPLNLSPLTIENVADLNERYGRPVRPEEIRTLYSLLGGQPYLTRQALELLTRTDLDFSTLVETADRDDGPFGDHLKRILLSVSVIPSVWDALTRAFVASDVPDSEGLQRLIAAGVLVRRSSGGYELPSDLYRRYLGRFLRQEDSVE